MNSRMVLKGRGVMPLQLHDPSIVCSCYSGTTCFRFPDFALLDDQSHSFSMIEVFFGKLNQNQHTFCLSEWDRAESLENFKEKIAKLQYNSR
jgi:hypothetical protein